MNDGFMRPAYPQQLIFSYYQASLVGELIERDFGPRAIVDMLNAYKTWRDDGAGVRAHAQDEPRGVRREVRRVPEGAVREGARRGRAEGRARRCGGARTRRRRRIHAGTVARASARSRRRTTTRRSPRSRQAKALFPEDASAQSPYWFLAQAYKAKGNARAEAAELTALTIRNEDQLRGERRARDRPRATRRHARAPPRRSIARCSSRRTMRALHVRLANLYGRLG